jgi:hypothetical protein
MDSFKIDMTGLMCRVDGVEAKTDMAGNPVLDKTTREPKFAVHLSVRSPERARPDQWTVTVVGPPKIAVDSFVTLHNVVAYPWEQNGRHGIALRAESITSTQSPQPASQPAKAS